MLLYVHRNKRFIRDGGGWGCGGWGGGQDGLFDFDTAPEPCLSLHARR